MLALLLVEVTDDDDTEDDNGRFTLIKFVLLSSISLSSSSSLVVMLLTLSVFDPIQFWFLLLSLLLISFEDDKSKLTNLSLLSLLISSLLLFKCTILSLSAFFASFLLLLSTNNVDVIDGNNIKIKDKIKQIDFKNLFIVSVYVSISIFSFFYSTHYWYNWC